MRIKNLQIKNIGPFKNGVMEFISSTDDFKKPPVIIITGENGTGKSIILDSIRTLFIGHFGSVEREIPSSNEFLIESEILINGKKINFKTNSKLDGHDFLTSDGEICKLFSHQFESKYKKDFVFDYWTSKLSNDSFKIESIITIDPKRYLDDALNGVHKNIDVTKVICFFDYLKDSKDEYEKALGKSLYEMLEEIINSSLTIGKLSHVSRINLNPIINIQNREITLEKLSSGSLYLIQRLSSLLSQIYSICVNNKIPISKYKEIEGILLIDEAENHLHPKWQKVFLRNILNFFPKLQIIVSTHSPFIVSSIQNSRVFVCQSKDDFSIIEEQTKLYSNKPVEEILMSPLFSTSNFNTDITDLLKRRKDALSKNDIEEIDRIESSLLDKNPEYFNYLNIEKTIKSIRNERAR